MRQAFQAIFLLLLLCNNVGACTFPGSGPEYDQLISITKLDEKNKFKVVVPRFIDYLYLNGLVVNYYKENKGNSEIIEYSDHFTVLYQYTYYDLFLDWITFYTIKKIEVEVELPFIEKHVPIVDASWWPKECCLCSVHGSSEPLILEKIDG